MTRAARATLVYVGLALLVASVLVPIAMWGGAGDWEDAIGVLVFTVIFAPIMFFVGLTLLIVGLVRSGRARQQQQQQVIVMDAGEAVRRGVIGRPGAAGFCTSCGRPMTAGDRFCTSCGAGVAP